MSSAGNHRCGRMTAWSFMSGKRGQTPFIMPAIAGDRGKERAR
jgi:hypothetical protein